MPKSYIVTTFDEDPVTESWRHKVEAIPETIQGPDPGEFTAMVNLAYPQVYAVKDEAKKFAEWATDEFFQVYDRHVPLVWQEIDDRTLDGLAAVDADGSVVQLYFRIREVDIETDDLGRLWVISRDISPTDREARLNEGEVFGSLYDAKLAVLRHLNITDEQAAWKDHGDAEIVATDYDPKYDFIIIRQNCLYYNDGVPFYNRTLLPWPSPT